MPTDIGSNFNMGNDVISAENITRIREFVRMQNTASYNFKPFQLALPGKHIMIEGARIDFGGKGERVSHGGVLTPHFQHGRKAIGLNDADISFFFEQGYQLPRSVYTMLAADFHRKDTTTALGEFEIDNQRVFKRPLQKLIAVYAVGPDEIESQTIQPGLGENMGQRRKRLKRERKQREEIKERG